MQNNENTQISKLPLLLVFNLIMAWGMRGNAQQSWNWTDKECETIEQFNRGSVSYCGKKCFNTIVSVSNDAIVIRDNVTQKERTIKLVNAGYGNTNQSNIFISTLSTGGCVWGGTIIGQNDVTVILHPGDIIVVDVNYDRIPGNNTRDNKHKNITPEEYYINPENCRLQR